jgi:thioredoxin 1
MAEEKKDEEKKPDAPLSGPSTPISTVPAAPVPQPALPVPAPPLSVPEQQDLIELDDRTWERSVEKSAKPVAVMFYSPTCVFCHQIEPYFRNYAREYRDTVVFARVNVMTSQWTAERYGVKSTPTFKFFCSGKPVQEVVGSVYPFLLKKMVDEVLVHGKECAKNSTLIDYEITGYG